MNKPKTNTAAEISLVLKCFIEEFEPQNVLVTVPAAWRSRTSPDSLGRSRVRLQYLERESNVVTINVIHDGGAYTRRLIWDGGDVD